jgi:plasmid stabilization system protein ParE
VRVHLKRRAAEDLRDAKAWYSRRSAGLGKRFAVEFDEVLREVITSPAAFQVVEGNVRRALLLRFPFSVYYTLENHELIILAVLHFRRHPGSWKDAL